MKPKAFFPILASILFLMSPAAHAGLYAFAGGGFSNHEFFASGSGSTYKFGLGLASPGHAYAIEASYVDMGDAYQPTAPTGYLNIKGTNVSVSSEVAVPPLVFGGRVGIYNLDAADTGYGYTVSSTGLSWGVTVGFHLNKHAVIFLDGDGYDNVVTPGGPETPVTTTIGLRVEL
jgi:hypothetical protein